jgi:hypothetical protein
MELHGIAWNCMESQLELLLSRERNSCVQGCVRRLVWAAIGSIMLTYAAAGATWL